MQAVELRAVRDVRLVEVDQPSMGAADALIEVNAVGVCGSDLHAFRGSHPFRRPPLVLGHEPAGRIAALGPAAKNLGLEVGQQVLIEPLETCGRCGPCLAGRTNLCTAKRFPATSAWSGAFAEWFRVPAAKLLPLPTPVPATTAALAEPLAVAVHALWVLGVLRVERLAILGGGSVGLLALAAARFLGVERVVVSDVVERKRGVTRELGGLAVNGADHPVEAALDLLGGPADGVLVASAHPAAIADAVRLAAPSATTVLLALADGVLPLPMNEVVLTERVLRGSVLYTRRDFQLTSQILTARADSLRVIVSHVLPFAEAGRAFNVLDTGCDDPIKVILTPGDRDAG